MRAISHSAPVFAPISASQKQPYAPQPVAENMQAQPVKTEPAKASTGVWENKSFSFWDILDAINPLQHIPVISTIYRKITGDEMGYAARIAGDTLYSGLFGSLISGLVSAVANVFVDSTTGKDITEHVIASITPSQEKSASTVTTVSQKVSQSTLTRPSLKQPTPNRHADHQQHSAIQFAALSPAATPSAMQPTSLPAIDPTRLQAGIDQYKWQIMADEIKTRSSRWV